jgi:predicted 3-demethylubiquinone-9 3-methyltransferase (glyoxalase superfamily)
MQKISPYLWFTDGKTEEAMNFYVSLFDNSRIVSIERYPEGRQEEYMQGMEGKVLTAVFELAGFRFMALDGSSDFQFNPSISFYVNCTSEDEIDRLYAHLSQDGFTMMPLQKYPFAEKYAWVQDRFGLTWQLSWQLTLAEEAPQKIIPALMFVGEQAGNAEEAMRFYTSLFPNSGIDLISRYGPQGPDREDYINHARFRLHGQHFIAMDSGFEHQFGFNEAISLYVDCDDQQEVNRLWDRLSDDPANEQCGWLKDRFGVSWQIIPQALGRLMSDPDPEKSRRVMDAMLEMKKIEVDELERAYEGEKV